MTMPILATSYKLVQQLRLIVLHKLFANARPGLLLLLLLLLLIITSTTPPQNLAHTGTYKSMPWTKNPDFSFTDAPQFQNLMAADLLRHIWAFRKRILNVKTPTADPQFEEHEIKPKEIVVLVAQLGNRSPKDPIARSTARKTPNSKPKKP